MGDVYESESVQLIVDNLVLNGLESNLLSNNAVSKTYVDQHITTAINALVDGAAPALDTLKEIGAALGNDANLASVLTSQIAAVNSAIAAEAAARSSSDATTNATFEAEVRYRTDTQNTTYSKISNLENLRSLDLETNTSASESTRRMLVDGDNALRFFIESEASQRNEAESIIHNRISDQSMQLETESMTRSSADALHAARLDAADISLLAAHSENARLSDVKFNKAGGDLVGDVTLVDSFLNFGLNWRVKASGDGTKILFQHKKSDGVWRTALPFICSV